MATPFRSASKPRRLIFVISTAAAFVLSFLGLIEKFPDSKATIIAVTHFQKLDPSYPQDQSNGHFACPQGCEGIVRFDVMNFEDRDFETKHIDISKMDARIMNIYSSGDTSNPPEELLRKRIRDKLRNSDQTVDGLELDKEHGEFEIKGLGLNKQDGLHLDLYVERQTHSQSKDSDVHNDVIGNVSLQPGKDNDKVNFVSLPLTELIRQRFWIEKYEESFLFGMSFVGAILTGALLLWVAYSKRNLNMSAS
jgi:hypothetical protein